MFAGVGISGSFALVVVYCFVVLCFTCCLVFTVCCFGLFWLFCFCLLVILFGSWVLFVVLLVCVIVDFGSGLVVFGFVWLFRCLWCFDNMVCMDCL